MLDDADAYRAFVRSIRVPRIVSAITAKLRRNPGHAAAHHNHILAAEKETITGGAIADAAPGKRCAANDFV